MSDDLELRALVMVALGEASMCWRPLPSGVFDDTMAIAIGDRLLRDLNESLPAYASTPPYIATGERVIVRCPIHGSPMYTVTAHGIEFRCRSCRGRIHFIPHTDIDKMRRGLAFLEETTPRQPADPPA